MNGAGGFGFSGGTGGGPGPGALTSSLVYRPGGVAGGNVYASWAALYAALVTLNGGAATIVIDDSIVTPAPIPAGAYNLNQCLIQGAPSYLTFSGGAALQINNGATFTSPSTIYFSSLTITYLGAAPCIRATAGQETNLFFSNDVWLSCSSGPFAESAGGFVYWNLQTTSLGGGAIPVATDDGSGGNTFVFAFVSTYLDPNAVTGGSASSVAYDSSVTINTQGAGVVLLPQDYANRVKYAPAVPANWPTPPTQVAQALDELAAHAAATPAATFVYRPGGTAGGAVYTSWAALYSEFSLLGGAAATIVIDDSLSAAAIPAGAYSLPNATIVGAPNRASASRGAGLRLDDGVTITAGTITFQSLDLAYFGSAAPCISVGANQEANVYFRDVVATSVSPGAPLLDETNGSGGFRVVAMGTTSLGDGAHALITDTGGGPGAVFLFDKSVANVAAIQGSTISYDSTSLVSLPQGSFCTLVALSQSSETTYAPAVPGNWATPPTEVAQALDELAASALTASGRYTAIDASTLIRWKMSEAVAPYANTGTGAALPLSTGIAGGVAHAGAGFFGSTAPEFNGGGGIRTANTAEEPTGNAWTLGGWVCLESLTSNFGPLCIKEYRNDGTHAAPYQALGIQLTSNNDGSWQASVCVGATNYTLTVGVADTCYRIPANQWVHVAATYDGVTLRAYFDGVPCGTLAQAGTTDFGTHGPYCVADTQNAGANVATGRFQDWRIENVVRSASYLRNLAASGLSLPLVPGF